VKVGFGKKNKFEITVEYGVKQQGKWGVTYQKMIKFRLGTPERKI